MQSSNQPGKISVPFAASGQKQPIPVASQIGIEDGRASYQDGFPPLTRTPLAAGGVPPFGTDMNGVINAITAIQQWQSAGGLFTFDATFAAAIGGYPRGAILSRADLNGQWRNTIEGNTSNPDTGGAGWVSASSPGSIGQALNSKISTASGATSATFTADEIVVGGALGGQTYRLASFSRSINLATTGAGGMDAGSAPVNGYLAIYAIYNPSSGATALLATNATSAILPQVYSAAPYPAGYSASCLVTVVPTNGSGQFKASRTQGRKVSIPLTTVLNSSSNMAITPISLSAAVPPNAIEISGELQIAVTAAAIVTMTIISDATLIGQQNVSLVANAGGGSTGNYSGIMLTTPQTASVIANTSAGTPTFTAYVSGYHF